MSAGQTNRPKLDAWLDAWPERLEARDDAFLQQFEYELEMLDRMGYTDREILCAVGERLYVRKWILCPRWMEWLNKLPSSLKWSDGKNYKRPKHPQLKTVIYGDTLFLSYSDNTPVGMNPNDKYVILVHDYKSRTVPNLVDGLPGSDRIEWALYELGKDHGLRMTNNHVHCLRDLKDWEEARRNGQHT